MVCQGVGKSQVAVLISHGSNYWFNLQPLYIHLNFSDLGANS